MRKLYINSTLIMLVYAIVIKIYSGCIHIIQFIWGTENSSWSIVHLREWQIMNGIEDVMIFIGWALFAFLVVNILVEYDSRKKIVRKRK